MLIATAATIGPVGLPLQRADRTIGPQLDWRFFFVGPDRIGHTTSEIARRIAGRCIRPEVSVHDLLENNWYACVSSAPNRTALGFIVESIVISRIATVAAK